MTGYLSTERAAVAAALGVPLAVAAEMAGRVSVPAVDFTYPLGRGDR